jgi:hypothetical protein
MSQSGDQPPLPPPSTRSQNGDQPPLPPPSTMSQNGDPSFQDAVSKRTRGQTKDLSGPSPKSSKTQQQAAASVPTALSTVPQTKVNFATLFETSIIPYNPSPTVPVASLPKTIFLP